MSDREEEVLDDEGQEQGFLSHLYELRDRLLRCVLAIIIIFACLFPFANEVYTFVAGPLIERLPEGTKMISIGVAAPFLTPLKLVLMASIFVAVPFLLSQIWGFIAPGLYKSEKRLAVPLLLSSTVLFYVGVAFSYFVVAPLVFAFFVGTAPEGVDYSPDIASYLDFMITVFFAFGIAFEVPIAVILLVAVGMTTPEALASKRPYFIVGAFIVGMFLTPPDVISQTLLALPMWLLFELGIIFSKIMLRKRKDGSANDMPLASPPISVGATVASGSAGSSSTDSSADYAAAEEAEAAAYEASKQMNDEEMEDELDRWEAEEFGPADTTDHSDAGGEDEVDPEGVTDVDQSTTEENDTPDSTDDDSDKKPSS